MVSLYSKQKLFCNICGTEIFENLINMIGRECKVCSAECLEEYQWRYALSLMGKEYRRKLKTDASDCRKEVGGVLGGTI